MEQGCHQPAGGRIGKARSDGLKAVLDACLLALLLWLAGPAFAQDAAKVASSAAVAEGYRVYRSFALTAVPPGKGRLIRLLQDARISEQDRAAHWGVDGASWGEQTPALLPSRLEILDARGLPLAVQILEVLADLQAQSFDDRGPCFFLLSVDKSIGMGSNNGLETTLLYPAQLGLRPMPARDAGGKTQPLHLLQSLRTAWRLVPMGKGQDILKVSSPLGGSPASSRIVYTRYHLQDAHWRVSQRSQLGLWLNEDDASFPPRAVFP